MQTLEAYLSRIDSLDQKAEKAAENHWEHMGKPIKSLGLLEDAVIRLAGIQGSEKVIWPDKKAIIVFCADHGVVKEGVTQTGQEVTRIVAENFTKGISSVNYMAKLANADVYPIDIGMNCPNYSQKYLRVDQVADYKVQRGTKNLACEPAMSLKQCTQAILSGIEIVEKLKQSGYGMLVTGEMGIGNTTPSSILTAVLLGKTAKEVTGRGAGLSKEGLKKKQLVVEKTINRLQRTGVNKEDVIRLLSEAGGFEIAGMMGAFLGGAIYKVPVVIDGIISSIAALLAVKLAPLSGQYMFASHESKEPSGKLLLDELQMKPLITCNMAPGEGVGGVMVLPILQMAVSVYQNMESFEQIGIETYENYEEKEE